MQEVLTLGMGTVFIVLVCVLIVHYLYLNRDGTSRIHSIGSFLFSTRVREVLTWEILGILCLVVYVIPGVLLGEVLIPLVIIACVFLPIVIYLRTTHARTLRVQDAMSVTNMTTDNLLEKN